jgi:PAS domain S-box-containing protein
VEQELASAQEQLKAVYHLAHIGTWDWIIDNDIVTWSEELYAISGRDPTQPAPTYTEHNRVYSPSSWVVLSGAVARSLKNSEPYDLELELVRPDGSTRWVNAFGGVKRDGNGKIIGLHGTVQDITDRKLIEDALRISNKKLNLLSSITRHDLNNQLTVLMGYISILEDELTNPTYIGYLLKVSSAAKRISAMIRFTKEYEEVGVKAPAWQDCRTLIETAAKSAPLGQVAVKNDIPAGAEVFADPLFVKVCYNLMDNAVRYGGKITTIRFTAEERDGDHLIVCEDDGEGVVAEEKEQIFERGFGKNTGMGLFLSGEILSITGITIRETGEPGKGARFEMTVPKGAFRFNKQ